MLNKRNSQPALNTTGVAFFCFPKALKLHGYVQRYCETMDAMEMLDGDGDGGDGGDGDGDGNNRTREAVLVHMKTIYALTLGMMDELVPRTRKTVSVARWTDSHGREIGGGGDLGGDGGDAGDDADGLLGGDLSKLTVKVLQKELGARGQDKKGRKAALVERLTEALEVERAGGAGIAVATMALEELHKNQGRGGEGEEGGRILIAMRGRVLDVSKSREAYGPVSQVVG